MLQRLLVGMMGGIGGFTGTPFTVPVKATFRFRRTATPDAPDRRYNYIECLSNLRNTNGRPTQNTAADPRFIDYYGRPWAQNWEKHFEQGWEKPAE